MLFSIRICRFLRPSPTLLIVAKPRFFKRPARCLDCLAAISIFFIAARSIFFAVISIFSSPRYRFFHCRDIIFFIAAISIFSSPGYQFFHRRNIDFFIAATSNFLRRDINFFAPSWRYSFGLTVAPPSGAVLQFLRRRALIKYHCAAIRRCSSIFAPTGALQ